MKSRLFRRGELRRVVPAAPPNASGMQVWVSSFDEKQSTPGLEWLPGNSFFVVLDDGSAFGEYVRVLSEFGTRCVFGHHLFASSEVLVTP